MAKGQDINIVHCDGPFSMVEIAGKLYWIDVQMKTAAMVVLPTQPETTASISLIGGQPKPVSV